jgi:hypothetical protein
VVNIFATNGLQLLHSRLQGLRLRKVSTCSISCVSKRMTCFGNIEGLDMTFVTRAASIAIALGAQFVFTAIVLGY